MKLYPYQDVASQTIEWHLNGNQKFMLLDAPPGTGKTFIGRDLMERFGGDSQSALYVCSSKALQRQFIEDFPEVAVLYGRSNYPTELEPTKTAADCLGKTCVWCETCPYKVAKAKFLASPVQMTNIAYFLYESNYVGMLQPYLLIIDEADMLEKSLLDFATLSLNERTLKLVYQIDAPSKKTVQSSWEEWARNAEYRVQEWLGVYEQRYLAQRDNDELKDRVEFLQTTLYKLKVLNDPELGLATGNWIYDGYKENKVIFKPIHIGKLAQGLIWDKAQKVVLMSGTIISARVMAENLGIEDYEEVVLPAQFPVENRPVIVEPIISLKKDSTDDDFRLLTDRICDIVRENTGRILIHTVSYQNAQKILAHVPRELRRRFLTYQNSNDAEGVLKRYLEKDGSVLLAPSFSRGISLDADKCEVVIIAKVPYPYLGDKQIQARLYSSGGQAWYNIHTIREIIQMAGRGMRSKEDHCTTFILDKNFIDLWRKTKMFFPQWFRESVEIRNR